LGQSWKDATARVPAQNGLITSKAKNAHMVKQVGRGFGPSERMTVDFSSLDQSTFNIVWDAWYNNKTFTLACSDAGVHATKTHELRLEPGK